MRSLVALLGFAVVGCTPEDGKKLVRVGQLTANHIRNVVPNKGPLGDFTIDATPSARARSRIMGDIYFADHPIQVVEEEDGLHLRGQVPSKEHKALAEQLAKQTVGVKEVVNELTVGQ